MSVCYMLYVAHMHICISVYDTCARLLTNKYNVDANLDASDNVISGNEPSLKEAYKPKSKNGMSQITHKHAYFS